MAKVRILLGITLLSLGLIAGGCGGTGENAADETEPAETGMEGEVAAEDTSPEAKAEQAAAIYQQALADTIEAMSGDPQPADDVVIEKVTVIRDENAAKLVEIGKLREKMGEDWGTKFDMALTRAFMQEDFRDLQQEYAELQSNYGRSDAGAITASINILTQYANFELLRKQAPEEAEKYGVAAAEEAAQ